MKKIIQLTLTLTLLSLFAVNTVSAQNLGNRTACNMVMSVVWGDIFCNTTGSFTTVVPPFSVVPIPMPPGNVIIVSRGYYVGSSCVYAVGIPCSGFPANDAIACGTACGNYRARLDSWGVVAYH